MMEDNNKEMNVKDQELEQVNGGDGWIPKAGTPEDNWIPKEGKPEDNWIPKATNGNNLKPYRCEKCGKWIEATQLWHVCVD